MEAEVFDARGVGEEEIDGILNEGKWNCETMLDALMSRKLRRSAADIMRGD